MKSKAALKGSYVVCCGMAIVVILFLLWPICEPPISLPERPTASDPLPTLMPFSSAVVHAATVVLFPPPTRISQAQNRQTVRTESPFADKPVKRPPASSFPLCVRIVDAIGDPISEGELYTDDRTYPFSNGSLEISSLPRGAHTLSACSSGYKCATQTVEIPLENTVSLILEYLTSFDFQVYSYQGDGAPVSGADVILWGGPQARRPVAQNSTIHLDYPISKQIQLRQEERGIHVIDVECRSPSSEKDRRSAGFASLKPGDLIVGVAGCMWCSEYPTESPLEHWPYLLLQNPTSPRLRAWDAIVAHADCDSISSTFIAGDYIEVERETTRFYSALGEMYSAARTKIVAHGTTDSAGMCHFEDLSPGLYVSQARLGKLRSPLVLLHTALAGAELHLEEKNKVLVTVKRSGISYRTLAALENADVSLKSVSKADGAGVFLGKTGVLGNVLFFNVPYGEYVLTVSPPSELSFPSKTLQVSVDRILNRFDISFEPANSSVSVSGKVLHADTRQPIGGITIEIFRITKPIGSHGLTKSGPDGSFRFSGLFPGKYLLGPSMKPQHYIGYLPQNGRLQANNTAREGTMHELTVSSEDLDDIECLVLPAIQTCFQGKVTTPQGVPVEGAKIVAKEQKSEEGPPEIMEQLPDFQDILAFVERDTHTDEYGQFSLSIMTSPDQQLHQVRFMATITEPTGLPEGEEGVLGSDATRQTRARGFLTTESFRFGDTLSDLHIVVEPLDYIVTGKISGIDTGTIVPVKTIFVFQDRLYIPGQLREDGSYRIVGLHPGPFTLEIRTLTAKIDSGPYAGQLLSTYCSESLPLRISPIERILTKNIALVRAGHLAGKIIDENQKPVPGCLVTAQLGERERSCWSDESGFFWLYDLAVQEEHVLKVSFHRGAPPVARLAGVKPPLEDIVIVVRALE